MSDMNRREFAEAIALASLAPLVGHRAGLMSFPALESGAGVVEPRLAGEGPHRCDPCPIRRPAARGRLRRHHPPDPGRARACGEAAQGPALQRRRARFRFLTRPRSECRVSDPTWLTIPELGRLLRDRRVSAVELAEHFLARLERLGPTYNAVVTVLRPQALAEARQRDVELAKGKIVGRCTAFRTVPRTSSPPRGHPPAGGPNRTAGRCFVAMRRW